MTTGPASHRIPSLDGLRACSILAVLLGHAAASRGFPLWLGAVVRNPYVDLAHLGVQMFFLISGFLITGLLLAEQAAHGRISLRRFYLRRTIRIVPPYLAFLAVLGVAAALGAWRLPPRDWWHALTYTMNYATDPHWNVAHFWSLAVEEQFYLLWPAALVWVGARRAPRLVVGALIAVPLIRVTEATLRPDQLRLIGVSFETAADALATGCLLALVREPLWANPRYRAAVRSRWVAPLLLVIGFAINYRYRPGLLIGIPMQNLGLMLLVDRAVRRPTGALGRALNAPGMTTIGVLSYSLYIWQQPFLDRYATHVINVFPLSLALAAACGVASYYAIERPALNARPLVEAWLTRRREADVALPHGWHWPRLGEHRGESAREHNETR